MKDVLGNTKCRDRGGQKGKKREVVQRKQRKLTNKFRSCQELTLGGKAKKKKEAGRRSASAPPGHQGLHSKKRREEEGKDLNSGRAIMFAASLGHQTKKEKKSPRQGMQCSWGRSLGRAVGKRESIVPEGGKGLLLPATSSQKA